MPEIYIPASIMDAGMVKEYINNRNKMKAKYGIFDDSYKLIRDDRDR